MTTPLKLPRRQTLASPLDLDQSAPAPAAGRRELTIDVPWPLSHQVDFVNDPCPNKVARWGRRTGKSRAGVICATAGHGPDVDDVNTRGEHILRPLHQGILTSRLDVAWICPTYKQSDPLWFEEIRPRFAGRENVSFNDTDKWVRVGDLGRLFVRTWENVGTIRGQGARLGGVIFDEAAHMDTRQMYGEIVLYALLDNEGWTLWLSTTNADHDGNQEKMPPSFFNIICQEIEQGIRTPDRWKAWYGTAYDNEKMSKPAIDTMIEEALRTGGRRRVDQEVYALLLSPGSGMAFPTWKHTVHVRALNPAAGWGCIGTLDWGSASPGAFYSLCQGPGGRLLLRNELYFNGPAREDWPTRLPAKMVGAVVAKKMLAFEQAFGVAHEYIAADEAMWQVNDAESVATKFQEGIDEAYADDEINPEQKPAPQLTKAPKGPGSRATRKELLTEALYWEAKPDDPNVPTVEGWPLLAVGIDCPHFARTIPALPNDPLDAEKVATDGEDHCYDSASYGLHQLVPEFSERTALDRANEKERQRLDPLSKREAEAMDALVKRVERDNRRARRVQ